MRKYRRENCYSRRPVKSLVVSLSLMHAVRQRRSQCPFSGSAQYQIKYHLIISSEIFTQSNSAAFVTTSIVSG